MKNLLVVLSLLAVIVSNAQNHHCSTDEMHQELYHQHPGIHQKVIENANFLQTFTENYWKNKPVDNSRTILYTIPVVFHVIHINGSENISDAQILDQLRITNEHFQKRNPDTTQTIAAFKGIAADCQIEFKLAKKDPNGNCTKGITRHYDARTINGLHDVKEIVQWDPTKYLNIYICRGAAGLAGHAVMPAPADTIPEWDGIVMASNSMGSIGTGNITRSVVMTHEIGHYLNLQHIWGGNNVPNFPYLPVGDPGNCAYDDDVADTPLTIGWSSCNLNHTSCSSLDNVQNFMEYAYCPTMFTEGQKQRMHATLNSPIAGRNNLWTPTNLLETGITSPEEFCVTDFTEDKNIICAGETIQFTDLSYNDVNTWNWTIDGGTPNASSDQNPTAVFNTPGVYTITLESGNGVDSDILVKNEVITVLPANGTANSIIEGFEANNFAVTQLIPVCSMGTNNWEISNQSGFESNSSLKLNNFNNLGGEVNEIVSEPINLSNINALIFTFDYAFAKKTSASTLDKLIVYASNDCGETWIVRKQLSSSSLLTVSDSIPLEFIPSTDNEWKNTSVTSITSTYWTDDFRIKIAFESGASGNHLYIDNINMLDPAMANVNLLDKKSVRVYPNPAKDLLNISNVNSKSNYIVRNLLGSLLFSGTVTQSTQLDISHLSNGVYFIEISDYNNEMTKKVVKFIKE